MCFGGVCAALIATALLPATVAAKPDFDPELRRSNRIDMRRLGKVSEDERAVLRIEWKVALANGEEAKTVRTLLDSLQRLEVDISEISRQVVAMPDRAPAATVAAPPAEPTRKEPRDTGMRLLVANIAAASLVALWLFRRRKAAEATKAVRGKSSPSRPGIDRGAAIAGGPEGGQAETQAQRIEPHLKPAPGSGAGKEARSSASPSSEIADTATLDALAPEKIGASAVEPKTEAQAAANLETSVPGADIAAETAETPMEQSNEPTLQLAEIMLSMGLDQGAAQALLEYIESHPRQAVYHWLKLLGIYRKKGLQQEFTDTAAKLRQFFNIQADQWDRSSDSEERSLEKFTRVSVQIQQLWLQPDQCLGYLRNLLEDNRDGARAGFPQAVAEEILFLIEIILENPVTNALHTGGTEGTAGTAAKRADP